MRKVRIVYGDGRVVEKYPNGDIVEISSNSIEENSNAIENNAPKTIQEFKNWYEENNLPPENITRFFIDKDIKEPKAFGIYYDYGKAKYVVYKNKADGTRSIRYEGTDEAYAVNELYMRLIQEIRHQKGLKNKSSYASFDPNMLSSTPLFFVHFFSVFIAVFTLMKVNIIPAIFLFLSLNPGVFIMLPILSRIKSRERAKKVQNGWHIISFVIFFILLLAPIKDNLKLHMNDGYYQSNDNNIYYHRGTDWYCYDNYWTIYNGSIEGLPKVSQNEISGNDVIRFEDSEYYMKENFLDLLKTDAVADGSSSSDSSWDSNDSWDSGSTDWDSDW